MTLVLGVLGVLVTAFGVVVHLRDRKKDRPPTGALDTSHRTRTIKRWHRSTFTVALACATEYRDALVDSPTTAAQLDQQPTERELTVWAANALLTAAAQVSRYSQGKANLWVVSAVTRDDQQNVTAVRIRSLSFVGPFPIWQLQEQDGSFRDMHVKTDACPSTAIGAAAYSDALQLTDIRGDHSVGDRERTLGTTHILAIPICVRLNNVTVGTVVGITVDMRIPRALTWLYRHHHARPFKRLTRRAYELQDLSRDLAEQFTLITRRI